MSRSVFRCTLRRSAIMLGVTVATGAVSRRDADVADLAITNVNVVDVRSGRVARRQTIEIRDGRIHSVRAMTRHIVARDSLDARSGYVVPGLWDMHAHVVLAGRSVLPAFVAAGVTGVRDAGGDVDSVRTWRLEATRGRVVAPRIVAAGLVLESPSFIQRLPRIDSIVSTAGIPRLSFPVPIRRVGVASAEEAADAVDSAIQGGAEFVKVRTSRDAPTFLAVARAAKARRLPLFSHAPPLGVSWLDAARYGLSGVEHAGGTYASAFGRMTAAARDSVFRALAVVPFFLDPNLVCDVVRALPDSVVTAMVNDSLVSHGSSISTVGPRLTESFRRDAAIRALEHRMETPPDADAMVRNEIAILREAHRAGVPFLAGTDLGALLILPGVSVLDELELFVRRVGMTPLDALRTATLNAARALRREGDFGAVDVGKVADLVVLAANPLDDIRHLRQVRAVVVNGSVVRQERPR